MLQRLDRLTKEEAQMAAIQTLEVVHGLVNNIKVVMDGTLFSPVHFQRKANAHVLDGRASSENIREALGLFRVFEFSYLADSDY